MTAGRKVTADEIREAARTHETLSEVREALGADVSTLPSTLYRKALKRKAQRGAPPKPTFRRKCEQLIANWRATRKPTYVQCAAELEAVLEATRKTEV